MPLSDIATINVSTTSNGVTRAGFGVPGIVSHSATWVERFRSYSSISAVGTDFAVNTPEYKMANAVFSQSPRVPALKILRAALQPTQSFTIGVQQVATGTQYKLRTAMATGTVWKSQDATYNSGGATGWAPSGVWSMGDLVIADGLRLYTCLGPSGGGHTGIGAASGPSGAGTAIQEGTVYWAFAGSGNTGGITNDAIINGLRSKVTALGSPTFAGSGTSQMFAQLAGSQFSRTLTLTANAPAKFFAAQVYDRNVLTLAQDHADPGIATDLAAIQLATSAWYGLLTPFNSELYVNAAASWVESNKKLYAAGSCDTAIPRVAESSATDVAHDLKAAAYARSWVFHHPSADEFADAAEMGKFLPYDPGTETWRMKELSGPTVESYTDTELTNMRDKYAHFLYDLGGNNVVGGDAKTGSGEFVDVTRGLDWYESELQADLVDLVVGAKKIPYTNAGIALVQAKIEKRNAAGVARGLISPDPAPTVTVPDIADVSTADKAARELSGVSSEFTLAGAIHHITVSVTANV